MLRWWWNQMVTAGGLLAIGTLAYGLAIGTLAAHDAALRAVVVVMVVLVVRRVGWAALRKIDDRCDAAQQVIDELEQLAAEQGITVEELKRQQPDLDDSDGPRFVAVRR